MSITVIPDDHRTAYITSRRALADRLQEHPEIPVPAYESDGKITFLFLGGDNPRADMAAAARAFPCSWRKETREYDDDETSYFDLIGEWEGMTLKLTAYRDAVCERVVTGTHTVTEKIKDPEALEKVPEIEVTKTVEEVEWVCSPVLAPAAAKAEGTEAA